MAAIDQKVRIIQLHNMGMDYGKIALKIRMTGDHVLKTILEYEAHGTITVNSKLNSKNYDK